MPEPLSLVLYSGVSVLLLFALFSYELRTGRRFMRAFRMWFDEGVQYTGSWLSRVLRFLERDVIRLSVHYFLHVVLASCLRVVRTLEKALHHVLHFNRQQARRSTRNVSQRTIFDEIKEHKSSVALTDAQKRKRKDKALAGK